MLEEVLNNESDGRYLYGLDLSLKNTGIAIYDLVDKEFVLVDSFNTEGIKQTNKYFKDSEFKDTMTLAEFKELFLNALKLYKLEKWLCELAEKYPPKYISIERGFSRFNTETQVLFRVHGVVNRLFYDVPQYYYPPKKIKAMIVSGNASKDLLRKTIKSKLPNVIMKNEDESDAVGIALTYLIENELIDW